MLRDFREPKESPKIRRACSWRGDHSGAVKFAPICTEETGVASTSIPPTAIRAARPWALVQGKPGARLELDVEFQSGRRQMPIVRLKRAARRGNAALQSVSACGLRAYRNGASCRATSLTGLSRINRISQQPALRLLESASLVFSLLHRHVGFASPSCRLLEVLGPAQS